MACSRLAKIPAGTCVVFVMDNAHDLVTDKRQDLAQHLGQESHNNADVIGATKASCLPHPIG